MFQIKNFNYALGEKSILKNININFEEGQIYGIIGPNGAGKSTLLKHMMRVIEPPKNTLFYKGKDIRSFKMKDYAKNVSFVFQENMRQVDFTVYEILLMGRYATMDLWGNISREEENLIQDVMKDLNIEHLSRRPISTLSGGEAQKVFIGRALVQHTALLLLDEPTSMLDIHNGIELIELIQKLKEKYKLTVVMVLHDLNLAFNYCNKILLLEEGQVINIGSRSEIFKDPRLQAVYHHKLYQIEGDKEVYYIVPKVNEQVNK